VFDREEGRRIAEHLGDGKAIILQNHGLLTVGETIDAAAFWFISLDKTWYVMSRTLVYLVACMLMVDF
jgi:ribulose-5-phosphate 4-epimerase/fuculose-1-phosphate aldolase